MCLIVVEFPVIIEDNFFLYHNLVRFLQRNKISRMYLRVYVASQVALGVKNPPSNAGDAGSVPGSGRSPGEGDGNPLQYSF